MVTELIDPNLIYAIIAGGGLSVIYGIIMHIKNAALKAQNGDLSGALSELEEGVKEAFEFLNYNNESATTTPKLIKEAEAKGACIVSMSNEDIAEVLSTCKDVMEQQSVSLLINTKQAANVYDFTVVTTGITYTIEQGFITARTPTDNSTMSANGNPIGEMSVDGLTINGTEIKDGSEIAQADTVGKPVNVLLTPQTYGEVIISAFFDDRQLGQKITDISATERDNKKIQIESFELPAYDSVVNHGEHTIKVKQGYYSGVDKLDKDVTIWQEDKTVVYRVNIL